MAMTLSMAGKAGPEGARQGNAADRGLQVEADRSASRAATAAQWAMSSSSLAPAQGAEAQQHGVVAERARRARLLDGLRGLADHAGDHDQRALASRLPAVSAASSSTGR